MANPERYPVRIEVPQGPITTEGTRRNCRMLVEYVEGWLGGRGAKGIDSLEGKPGIHPALMEDLATGRMSVAQIAQRIRHRARSTGGPADVHDFAMVKRVLVEEVGDILRRRAKDPAVQQRYRHAAKIALRWIKNYVDLDFRSLGSYPRPDLDRIAASPDAF
jgi:malate synthase